jgi:hypothetical protein
LTKTGSRNEAAYMAAINQEQARILKCHYQKRVKLQKRLPWPRLQLWLSRPWSWIDHPVSGLAPATIALFRLGFPTATVLVHLNLAANANSPVRSTKSTPSRLSSALTACKRTVSGSISLPSRGAFHLSLAVLVHYRSPGVFSLGAWSPRLPTRFLVPRGTLD